MQTQHTTNLYTPAINAECSRAQQRHKRVAGEADDR